jgi:hypothetical protein
MNLDAVAFPALLVADDGWVDYLATAASLTAWTNSAIGKYSKRRVVLCDHRDQVWLIERITPQEPRNALARLAHAARNPRIAVTINVCAITEEPMEAVKKTLFLALEADDDVLTQNTGAPKLRAAIQRADSFDAFVRALRTAKAIE